MAGLLEDNYKDTLAQLEMLRPDGEATNLYFVADKKDVDDPRIRFALEQAIQYQADAVFFRTFPEDPKRSPIPQIYIYRDTSLVLDVSEYAIKHKKLWNAGVVPLVFILTLHEVKILNCRQEPEFDKDRQTPVYTPFCALEQLVAADQAFAAREVSSGALWDDPKFKNDFVLENTAYYKLLSQLKAFREKLLALKILSENTVNRVLVMAILVKYLNDRQDTAGNRVFQSGFFRRFSQEKSDDLAALFYEKGSCTRLFDHLSEHFNGGIFELTDNEKTELEQAAHLLRTS